MPLAVNAIRSLGLFVGVGPRVDECADRLVPVEVRYRNLELVGGGSPLDPRHAHPVFPLLLESDRGKVRDAIGRDVLRGIPHLVDQLLGHAGHADPPAGAGMLEDLERSVWGRVHDRVADIREVRDALPVYEAVAPGTLRAALDRMARDRPGGEEVPGVWPPPKGMNQRPEGEPGVGDASRDDDV